MKVGDNIHFIYKKQAMSSNIVQIIGDNIGVTHPDDERRILYVDKHWVFSSQRETERRLKQYGWAK